MVSLGNPRFAGERYIEEFKKDFDFAVNAPLTDPWFFDMSRNRFDAKELCSDTRSHEP